MKFFSIASIFFRFRQISILILAVVLFQSCSYSVIVSSKNGVAQPGINSELGHYNGKEFVAIDTVVNLSLIENRAYLIPDCSEGGFHSVEYKITFGAMLRNTLTFGKKQSIKVKYVCIKDSNQ